MNCYNHIDREANGACVYCGKFYCEECLVNLNGKNYCKAHIEIVINLNNKENGKENEFNSYNISANPNPIIINNNNPNIGFVGVKKSRLIAALLCLILGWLGFHRFYTGKVFTGIIYMFTFGLFGIGILIDLILIITGAFRDKSGFPLT